MLRWTRKILAIMVIIFRQCVNTRYVRNFSAFTQYDCLWKNSTIRKLVFQHDFIDMFLNIIFKIANRIQMFDEISNWFKKCNNPSLSKYLFLYANNDEFSMSCSQKGKHSNPLYCINYRIHTITLCAHSAMKSNRTLSNKINDYWTSAFCCLSISVLKTVYSQLHIP